MSDKAKKTKKIGFWENLRRSLIEKVNPDKVKRLEFLDNAQTDVKKAHDIAKSGGFYGRTPEKYANFSEYKDLDEATLAEMLKLYKTEAKATYTDLFKKESKSQGLLGEGKGWSFPILNMIKGSKHYKKFVKGLESGNIEAIGFDKGRGSIDGAFSTLYSSHNLNKGYDWERTLEKENAIYNPHPLDHPEGVFGPSLRRSGGKGWNLPMDAALMYLKLGGSKERELRFSETGKLNLGNVPSLIATLIHEGAHMPGKFLTGEYHLKHGGKLFDKTGYNYEVYEHLDQNSFWKTIINATKNASTKKKNKSGLKLIDKLIEDADNKVSGIDFMITDPKKNKEVKEKDYKNNEKVYLYDNHNH